MGYIIHEVFHFLVGASLAYILVVKDIGRIGKRTLILFFGGITAISPDITKLFGDILGHSIWLVTVFGLVFALVFHFLQKDVSFFKSWGIFSLIVLVGHIFIDYIGNGVAFLYPITHKEYSLSIITRTDEFVLYTLLFVVLIGLFYRKGKMIILTGMIIISLYLCGLTVSKFHLENTLKTQYEGEDINLLLSFRSRNFLEWNFMVRTDKVWVSGYSPILNQEIHIESEREVDE
ncbi:metal-dependent hydrolase [Bacillus sp. JJ1562]|uniref:metal-dependent hydrolase n=1 Tax=Bacillus sp. JJ1562 TaxID=3122960 RepID=UPI0030015E14